MSAIRTIKGEPSIVYIVTDSSNGIAIGINDEKVVVSSSDLLMALSECIHNQLEGRCHDKILPKK